MNGHNGIVEGVRPSKRKKEYKDIADVVSEIHFWFEHILLNFSPPFILHILRF